MTKMKFGWPKQDASVVSSAPRQNNLYQKARPASLNNAPNKWSDIRNLTDGQKGRPLRPAAASKAIDATDKPA